MTASKVGLLLTGGGARSSYQAGCLRAIAEISNDMGIAQPFPIITGMSAGTINACYIAGNANDLLTATQNLQAMWNNLTSDQVYETGLWHVIKNTAALGASLVFGRSSKKRTRALLNTDPLLELLNSRLDFRSIGHQIEAGHLESLALTAVSYYDGYSHTFYQTIGQISPWIRARRTSLPSTIGPQHVMASTAIPLLFPPAEIDGTFYGDGSLRNYAPLSPAIKLGAEKILVIGVRRPTLVASQEEHVRTPSIGRVFSVLLNSLFLDAIDLDYERLQRINLTLQSIPENVNTPLKPVDVCLLMPSEDVGRIAYEEAHHMPRVIKYLIGRLGKPEETSGLISYLLFEPSFTQRLTQLGYDDTWAKEKRIREFLSS